MQSYCVYGIVEHPTFQKCADAAAYLNASAGSRYHAIVNYEMPTDFYSRRQQLQAGGVRVASAERDADSTTMDNRAIGQWEVVVVDEKQNTAQSGDDFLTELEAKTKFRVQPSSSSDVDEYSLRAEQSWRKYLRDQGNRYCWMDVRRGDVELGRITFELYSKVAPLTSSNFWRLCRGNVEEAATTTSTGEKVEMTYKDTTFFRVLKGAWVMGGDISPGHTGNGGFSHYGRFFPDETFAIAHDRPGIVGMCNDGAHSNASSFYITRKKMSWMNEKYVAFGRVINGMHVVDAIHDSEVKHNQAPREAITIADCGIVDVTM